jgi:hypothetical protein
MLSPGAIGIRIVIPRVLLLLGRSRTGAIRGKIIPELVDDRTSGRDRVVSTRTIMPPNVFWLMTLVQAFVEFRGLQAPSREERGDARTLRGGPVPLVPGDRHPFTRRLGDLLRGHATPETIRAEARTGRTPRCRRRSAFHWSSTCTSVATQVPPRSSKIRNAGATFSRHHLEKTDSHLYR